MNHTLRWSLFAVALCPFRLAAQEIPPYVPANPLLASRSALYAQPFVLPATGTGVRIVADYYNAVEVAQSTGFSHRQSIFDAELLQADIWLTRDLSRRVFLIADLPIRGGYNGVFDGALNWYHKLIGLSVPARDQLPKNVFDWSFVLPDTNVLDRTRPGTFLGDIRVGAGARTGRVQLIASITLPTATGNHEEWSRHVVGTSLALTGELLRSDRLVIDASASAGITPTHGGLSRYQRSVFASGLLAGRWRFAGQQAVYSSVWAQSANWKDTGFNQVDDHEVTMDFGFLFHLKPRWPELQVGMTQDLLPRGPSMDVGLTIGLRW